MVQTCRQCSRANPPDAVYCYFDGLALDVHGRAGGPMAIGAQRFNNPFVFPSGRNCRSFDELAVACQEEWDSARDLLRQGYLEGFLGGLGRIDLALAARAAGKFPDADRGLDQLLAKLPSDVLAAPQLRLEPLEINLGVLTSEKDRDRSFELNLENQGMRLLSGTVSCTDAWLTLGDAPGLTEKHFDLRHELKLPVKVCGDRLRAGPKPLEGKLLVESNGGAQTVVVRATVPVRPYADGLFAGCKSPRELALKAKAAAREAAPIFERGDVAAWYQSNGWSYPVQGPAASGMGAIQQFFEALGLVPAPRVEVSAREIHLAGNPGEALSCTVEVKTQEKKYVYAHGVSDQPWLQVGRPRLKGQTAAIPLKVVTPDVPGETLSANLTVQANGNQRFVLPVRLQVGEGFHFGAPRPPLRPPTPLPAAPVNAYAEPALLAAEVLPDEPVPVMSVESAPIPVVPPAVMPAPAVPPVQVVPAVVMPAPAPTPRPAAVVPADDGDPFTSGGPAYEVTVGRRRGGKGAGLPLWVHGLPALLLALGVGGAVIADLAVGPSAKDKDQPPGPEPLTELKESDLNLYLAFSKEDSRFGLRAPNPNDPNGRTKKLTSEENGIKNNTRVKIDDISYLFGRTQAGANEYTSKMRDIKKYRYRGKDYVSGGVIEMDFKREGVLVTQHVEVVKGKSQKMDTCLIHYTIKNHSSGPRTVGLRLMLDTYVGDQDGVPILPGGEGNFITTSRDFPKAGQVPRYLEAIENPESAKDSGLVARLVLKGVGVKDREVLPVDRVVVSHWPGANAEWEFPIESIDKNGPDQKDSSVAVYWNPRRLEPGDEVHMAITYGLGEIDVTEGDASSIRLGFSDPGTIPPGSEFTLIAYAYNAKAGDRVKLSLPAGLSLAADDSAEKTIDQGGKRVMVEWRLKAGGEGVHEVEASSGNSKTRPFKVKVASRSIFG